MTPYDCIRAAIPEADDELCHFIVWGRTPFPFKKLSAREFYKAGSRFKRAGENNLRLCDHCDNLATDGWCCKSCSEALSAPHPDDLRASSVIGDQGETDA
jgi:hypothetical protein